MLGLAELPRGAWLLIAFALGAAIGSFLNVVIHRLPRGESLIRPASRCPGCGSAIPVWANVPVLSYVLLRGRCLGCKMGISRRYPLVEMATALLFMGLLLRWGLEPRLLVQWAVAAALVAIIFIDIDHQIIPNSITLPGIPIGLAYAWGLPTPPGIVDALFGLVVAGGMMWLIAFLYEWRTGRIGLGMGDVKLVCMLGSFLGLQGALGVLVIGSFLGLGQALFMLAFKRAGRLTRIPFGPALAGAGILHLFDPEVFSRLLGQP